MSLPRLFLFSKRSPLFSLSVMEKPGLEVLSSAAPVSCGSSLDFGIMSQYSTEETVALPIPELSSLCVVRVTFLSKYSSQPRTLIPDSKPQHGIVCSGLGETTVNNYVDFSIPMQLIHIFPQCSYRLIISEGTNWQVESSYSTHLLVTVLLM